MQSTSVYWFSVYDVLEKRAPLSGLASWGCGASCVMGAAIDAKTGVVTHLRFTISNWPLDVTEPLGYKPASSLLIVRGSRNEKGARDEVQQSAGLRRPAFRAIDYLNGCTPRSP